MTARRIPRYSERLDSALSFAAAVFRDRARKGSDIPYLTHLLQVMVLVSEYGGTEDQMIAALLHDYLEDIENASRALVVERFGEPVARLVDVLTESTTHPRPPWRERKERYIERLRTAPAEVKLISAADKLHNATSLRRSLEREGAIIWKRFTGTPTETMWFYRSVTDAIGHGWTHPLLDALWKAVARLERAAKENS